jgi:hypothetical protein
VRTIIHPAKRSAIAAIFDRHERTPLSAAASAGGGGRVDLDPVKIGLVAVGCMAHGLGQ